MFQFPPCASLPLLHSDRDHRILLLRGFPIRTHTGQRLFGSSPYSFVAYTVLLRQHVPRHPPRALSRLSLTTCVVTYLLPLVPQFPETQDFLFFAYSQTSEALSSQLPPGSGALHLDSLEPKRDLQQLVIFYLSSLYQSCLLSSRLLSSLQKSLRAFTPRSSRRAHPKTLILL